MSTQTTTRNFGTLAALITCLATALAFAQGPALSPAEERGKAALEILRFATKGVGALRLEVLSKPDTAAYLASEQGMSGFVTIHNSFQNHKEMAAEGYAKFADLIAGINNLRCWDGYLSASITDAAIELDPAIGEKLRKAYVGLISRTISMNEFSGPMAEQTAIWHRKNLDLLTGPGMRRELLDRPAPELTFLWSSDGKMKKLADLKGKVVVLDFWATWCKPCIATFPKLRDLVASYAGKPVVFLGVTSLQGFHMDPEKGRIDTKGDPVKEQSLMPDFMKKLDMTWPVVISDKDAFNPDYNIRSIPYIAILDAEGVVRHVRVRPEELREKIDSLLDKK